ncbi:unnamed protein product [Fusarium graminearum]|uniref:Uncharacterized protein n=1 Tax=Gibberella zeae TaxID=5518 RepID=A0A9N8WSH9_GIBZA|nr:unnamed protein product [Fusarium graminearum]CAF3582305.1 unnamed protein product [Fusarium graminearum]CAG1967637.1 unnamed protein product [Fusarium graminearum]CAG1988435.1 unnamed protein product [Fusarium graminearum]
MLHPRKRSLVKHCEGKRTQPLTRAHLVEGREAYRWTAPFDTLVAELFYGMLGGYVFPRSYTADG